MIDGFPPLPRSVHKQSAFEHCGSVIFSTSPIWHGHCDTGKCAGDNRRTTKFFRSEIYWTDMVSHSKKMTRINVKGSDDGRREARNLFPNAKPARKYAP